MTAEKILELNGNLKEPGRSPLFDLARRFDRIAKAHGVPYCVVGGVAVVRNGYARTTADLDILTIEREWKKVLPLAEEEIRSTTGSALDGAVDERTGLTIDILSPGNRQMVFAMPDPREVSEYDHEKGACFIRLHELVQLKMAVYLSKRAELGLTIAAKNLDDVRGLMANNIEQFSPQIVAAYHPAVRRECQKALKEVLRAQVRGRRHGPNEERQ